MASSSRCLRTLLLGILVLGSYNLLSDTFTGHCNQLHTRKISSRTGRSVARRAEEEEGGDGGFAADLFEVGQEVECVVAGYNTWGRCVDLAGADSPRHELMPGAKVTGKVIKVLPKSAFISIDGKVIMGNLHVNQINHEDKDAKMEDFLSVGDQVEARVYSYDQKWKRWKLTTTKKFKGTLQPGDKVKTKVKIVFHNFALVEFEAPGEAPHYTGLIHKEDLTTNPDADIKDLLSDGQEIELCFVDYEQKSKAVFVKCDSPLATQLKIGTKVKGKVSAVEKYSAKVDLDGTDLEGVLFWANYEARVRDVKLRVSRPKQVVEA